MSRTSSRISVYSKPPAVKNMTKFADKGPKQPKPRISFKRKLLNAFMILSIGLGSSVVTAAPAQANWVTDGLNQMCATSPSNPWAEGSGIVSTGSVFDAFVDMNHEGGKMTILEKFGFAGPTFTSWVGPFNQDTVPAVIAEKGYNEKNEIFSTGTNCFKPMNHATVIVGNTVLGLAKTVTFVNATLFQFTVGDDTLDNKMSKMVEEQLTGLPAGSTYNTGEAGGNLESDAPVVSNGQGLRDTIYGAFVYISIMIAGLRLAWIGLIKREIQNSGTYILKVILVAVIAVLTMNFPGTMMKWADNVTDHGGTVLTSMISNVSNADGTVNNYCTVDAGDGTITEQTNRKVQCILYYYSVFQPWEEGQFGVNTSKNIINIGVTTDLGGVPASPNTLGIYQAENQIKHETDDEQIIQVKETNRLMVALEMIGNPSEQVEGAGSVNDLWAGSDFGGRLGSAFIGLATSLAHGFILIPSCIAYIVAILAFKLSLIALPMVLVLSLPFPEILKKFAGMDLAFLVKGVAHLIFIGLSLNIMISMTAGPEPAIMKVMFLFLTAGILHFMKQPIIDVFVGSIQNHATQAMDKISGAGNNAVGKTAAVGAGALGGMAAAIRHQSRNGSSKSNSDKKGSGSTTLARPKAVESMSVHSSADNDNASSESGRTTTTSASASQRHRQGPFATSEDGTTTTTRPDETETAAPVNGPSTRRSEPGFTATDTASEPSAVPADKEPTRTEVNASGKDETRNRVTPTGFTAAALAGGAKGAVAGARSSSAVEGLTSGAAAGTETSRRTIEQADHKNRAREKQEADKERQEELRNKITGALPKSSPTTTHKGGLPKRNTGGLPGSSGGAPRTGR